MPPPPGSSDGSEACTTKSLAEAQTGPTFSRFNDLPCEIRLKIWEECIPGQLIIVNRRRFVSDSFGRALRSQRRPPVISQVCHEARVVALDGGSQLTLGTWLIDKTFFKESLRDTNLEEFLPDDAFLVRSDKAWFSPKKDTFVLYRPFFPDRFGWAFRIPLLRDAEFSLVGDWIEPLRVSNRIAFSALGGYESLGLKHSPPYLIPADKGDKNSRTFITHELHLHASLPDAIETGLFGLFGEKRVIMVDLYDTETFKSLVRIAKKLPGGLLRDFACGTMPSTYPYNSHEQMLKHEYLLSVLKAKRHRMDDDCEWHWQDNESGCCGHETMFDYRHPYVHFLLGELPAMRLAVLVILYDEPQSAQGNVEARAVQAANIFDF